MPTLKPQLNIPIEVRLQSVVGEVAPSNFGDPQVRFATDQGLLYVSQGAGNILLDQIRKQNIQPGEPVEICKREVDLGRGRKSFRWELNKVGFIPGEQPDGTFAVERQPAAAPVVPINRNPAPVPQVQAAPPQSPAPNGNGAPHPNGNGGGNGNHGNGTAAGSMNYHQGWAQFLLSQTQALIDVYALALNYAGTKHGNAVKPEDVKTLLTTAFINLSKGGSCNVA